MKILLTFILLIISFSSFGQSEVVIQDSKDESESFAYLKDKVLKRELASFTIEGSFGDTSVKDSLPSVPVKYYSDSSATFIQDNLKINITSTKFDTIGHILKYQDKTDFLSLIDGKPIWGTDGNIPKRKIKSLSFTIGEREINIPHSAIVNLFEPSFCWKVKPEKNIECRCHVYLSKDKRRIYINMLNSDGAGAYEVTWIFQDNQYLRRVIDSGF